MEKEERDRGQARDERTIGLWRARGEEEEEARPERTSFLRNAVGCTRDSTSGVCIRDVRNSRGSIVLVPRGCCSLVGYLGTREQRRRERGGFSAAHAVAAS